jgi:predicted lipoprotein with Yx(FWY)xxD motif
MRISLTIFSLLVSGALAAGCSASSGARTNEPAPVAAPSGAAPPGASPVVGVVSNVKLGNILVGPNGHTLYLFEDDNGTMSACTGACADIWPALAAEGMPAGTGVDLAKLTTAHGQVVRQVAYNGHLLYYFSGDAKPGETNGLSIPHWDAIAPDGNKIPAGA